MPIVNHPTFSILNRILFVNNMAKIKVSYVYIDNLNKINILPILQDILEYIVKYCAVQLLHNHSKNSNVHFNIVL